VVTICVCYLVVLLYLQVSNLKRQLAMDKDAAFQEMQVKNEYLSQQVDQMEKVVAHKTKLVSAVSLQIHFN